jgi:hypothetical protein
MSHRFIARWRINFFAGLAVVLPIVISLAIVVWLFGTVAGITDTLLWLFFLPREWTHQNAGHGPVHWYSSLLALLAAVRLIGFIGRSARHYIVRKLIQMVDLVMLRVPLLNKIYGSLEWAADVVALGLLLALMLTGLLPPKQAFAGFGSETVLLASDLAPRRRLSKAVRRRRPGRVGGRAGRGGPGTSWCGVHRG